MSETNLRNAINRITIVGVLDEKNLKRDADSRNPGQMVISGNLVVRTGKDDTVTLTTAPMRPFTKKGEENRIYSGLNTVVEDYKSVAEYGRENADWVRLDGASLNPYYSVKRDRPAVGYRMLSIRRVFKEEEQIPQATFEIELYVSSIVPENINGEDTGRVVVRGWLPMNIGEGKVGVEKVNLVAPEEIASAVTEAYRPGDTVRFYGDIINTRQEEKTQKAVKIGVAKEEARVRYVSELRITGASEAYDIDNPNKDYSNPFPKEAIELAITERDHRIEEMKKNGNSNGGSANYAQRPSSTPVSTGRKLPW